MSFTHQGPSPKYYSNTRRRDTKLTSHFVHIHIGIPENSYWGLMSNDLGSRVLIPEDAFKILHSNIQPKH